MSSPRPAPDRENGERYELAESIRRLIVATTTGGASGDDLAAAYDLVEAAAAMLGPLPSAMAHRSTTEQGHRPTLDPFGSADNPLAPPLWERPSAAGEYIAEFVLSPAYEGPPGRVHGGVVTGILDHACGFAPRSLGIVAVSVSLAIDLHRATPYAEPLTVAARVDERDGRKIWVDAQISTAAGEVTASCRTLMLELRETPAWAQAVHRDP
ncbi:PaaI family thioesterase [Actinomadura sp. LOL_016]|uniref:PaaI family thioesterase n=1 Tax=unclassified Actinomadura TaxID=2626254 RepID=UPI003A7FFE4C